MALLLSPQCTSSFCSIRSFFCYRKPRVCSASFAVKTRVVSAAVDTIGTAILWYKHDLRIDDHPGLVAAAAKHRSLVPLYVFDHRILSRFTDEMLELLVSALIDLRRSLKEQGSNLMIRFGSAECIIAELANEVKATSIFVEEEVEYDLCEIIDSVKDSLARKSSGESCPRVLMWRTPLYGIENLKDLPESYHDFKRLKMPVLSPLLPPRLPAPEVDLVWGDVPMLDDLKNFLYTNAGRNKWTPIKKFSAKAVLQENSARITMVEYMENATESNLLDVTYKNVQRESDENSGFVAGKVNLVGGGTNSVLNALAAYLRHLEGAIRDDWREVHQKLQKAESREGASFGTLFGSALHLGVISRRRVHSEAIKYEKDRNVGFLSPFGYSAVTVAATINTICSIEWYWQLALKDRTTTRKNDPDRIWRWNGYIVHYTVAGSEGPAILLVHGFGAFLEHYRYNINQIAQGGNRVWAITLLGFGKSEKPNLVYTELMWAELLRDFIVEVVGGAVHVIGNSIGGYFVSLVAGLWPGLTQSVVLINSAGNIIPGYTMKLSSKERQSSFATWLGARLLLLYLRLNIKKIVKRCYPTKPDQADDWLIEEMLRASHDPGVAFVLESIFSLDLSIPLNYLFRGLERKVLVIQGMKDPISNSKSKLAMLREHCKGVVIREVDAGHCPHDEQPGEVNSIIQNWVATLDNGVVSVGSK